MNKADWEAEKQRRYRIVDAEMAYERLCKRPVAQDSHCVLQSGHVGECKDNMGWTLSLLNRVLGQQERGQ